MTNWVRNPAPYDHNKSLHENRMRDRGSVRCNCGAEVNLQMHGDTNCDECGQLFNAVGQMLNPPSMWEEPEYDD